MGQRIVNLSVKGKTAAVNCFFTLHGKNISSRIVQKRQKQSKKKFFYALGGEKMDFKGKDGGTAGGRA